MTELYLVIGLGNPGRKYTDTRHNVGWHVLDALAQRHGLAFAKTERKALTASGEIAGRRVLLAKPQTFMNLSGEAARGLVDFYKIDLARLLVVADDLDLPLGTLRLRPAGSAGGQRGVASVIQHLGTPNFNRLRFGIGRPPGKMDPVAYVLQAFSGDDAILARETAGHAAAAIETWLRDGIEAAMSRYNGDLQDKAAPPASDPQADLALYLRAHELNRADPGPVEKIIAALRHLQRADEAAGWHVVAADLYSRRSQTRRALSHLERAAALRPHDAALRLRLARAYADAGVEKKALSAYLHLAEHLRQTGRPLDALQAVSEALRLNPQHPDALRLHDALRRDITY